MPLGVLRHGAHSPIPQSDVQKVRNVQKACMPSEVCYLCRIEMRDPAYIYTERGWLVKPIRISGSMPPVGRIRVYHAKRKNAPEMGAFFILLRALVPTNDIFRLTQSQNLTRLKINVDIIIGRAGWQTGHGAHRPQKRVNKACSD